MPPHIQVAKLMPYSISYCTEPCRLLAQDNALMAKLRSSNFTFGIYDPTDACGWLLFEQLAIPYASYSGGPMLYHSDAALGSSTPFSFVPSQVCHCWLSLSLTTLQITDFLQYRPYVPSGTPYELHRSSYEKWRIVLWDDCLDCLGVILAASGQQ